MTQQGFSTDAATSQGFDPHGRPPRRKSSTGCWILAIVLLLGGAAALICCGGGLWVMRFGLNMVTTEVEDQLRDNPRLREQVGDVESFEMDWTRSLRDQDEDTFVYRVRGTKGTGQVTVRHVTGDDGNEKILSAQLRLPSGETVELVPESE